MNIFDQVEKHHLGFYQLKKKPSIEELKVYYEKKYFQDSKGTYKKKYTKEEEKFRFNRLNRKLYLINQHHSAKGKHHLDIGCGEGWSLRFFKEAGWEVTGLDYSSEGISHFNSELSDSFIQGDIYNNLENLAQGRYTHVLLDNVLEHVIEPEQLLKSTHGKLVENALLTIEVPNDFSPLQLKLIDKKLLKKPNWIFVPDHINYFSLSSLIKLAERNGFKFVDAITDFPIDFFLANEKSNYYNNKGIGKNAHEARLLIENLMDESSIENTINLYRSMIQLGFGRNIIAIFRKQ